MGDKPYFQILLDLRSKKKSREQNQEERIVDIVMGMNDRHGTSVFILLPFESFIFRVFVELWGEQALV